MSKRYKILFTLLVFTVVLIAQNTPIDVQSKLSSYNVVFTNMSTTGSSRNIPIGNGDITSNVWVESNGDLVFYIGKSDCWSESTRLLKVGRIRLNISPNPFASGNPFRQELDLYKGEMIISAGKAGSEVSVRIWIDANYPVIHIQTVSSKNTKVKCTSDIYRTSSYTMPASGNSISESFRGVINSPVKPVESADVAVATSSDVVWYHRNGSSMFSTILGTHGMGAVASTFQDPYINLTFGALLKGVSTTKINNTSIVTTDSVKQSNFSIYCYTAQTTTYNDWKSQIDSIVTEVEKNDLIQLKSAHFAWWDAFWSRSWVFASGTTAATNATRSWLLQRFMNACQGRGKYPFKFNGGNLTFDYNGKNGDFRRWGPGYWNQNNRLLYWPMLACGDYDLMLPWFNMYMNMMELQKAATKKLYNHNGAYFPETFNFFGLHIGDDWGWNNSGNSSDNPYVRFHYSGALEVLAQMLDYYNYKQDKTFANNYIIPFATEVVRFFNEHWSRENGKIKFYPAYALETYWDCTNPTDYLAGLKFTISQLIQLPSDITTSQLVDEWNSCLTSLPEIERDNVTLRVYPAETYGAANNYENPELYAVFPYRIYGIGRDSIGYALNTFANRVFTTGQCWHQDGIQAALCGLTDKAVQYLNLNVSSVETSIPFPAFWGAQNDYMPDLDNGGVLMLTLQNMLLQQVGSSVYVLPAFPSTWSVDFRLNTYNGASVRLISSAKTIQTLELNGIQSSEIVQPNWKQNQSISFSPISDIVLPSADLSLTASASSGQPITYESSDNNIATIVNGKIHPVKAGKVTISAFQSGNANYNASPLIKRQISIVGTSGLTKSDDVARLLFSIDRTNKKIRIQNYNEGSIAIYTISGVLISVLKQPDYKVDEISTINWNKGVYIMKHTVGNKNINYKIIY